MLSSKKTISVLLLVMMFFTLGAVEGRTDGPRPESWQEKIRKLHAEGKGVNIMRSKSKKPEKSPEEFLRRYKKIREKAGDSFTFQTFVEDIARGLVVEQLYIETGVSYNAKENLNPNYSWKGFTVLAFNCDKFCITPEMLRRIFGKEDRIITINEIKTTQYRYFYMGIYFDVDDVPSISKKCTYKAIFDSDLFRKMEK